MFNIDSIKKNHVQPSYSEVYIGDKVTFKCLTQIHRKSLFPQWFFQQGPIQSIANVKSWNSIIIKSVQMNHSGIYTCYGYYRKHMKDHTFISSATLKVVGKIIIL